MPILFEAIIKALLWFGAGVGATSLVDKFIPDKLPAGVAPLTNYTDRTGKTNWTKVVIFVVVGAIGILIVKFIGRKLNVKLLK